MIISVAASNSIDGADTMPNAAKRSSAWRLAGAGLVAGAIAIGSLSAWHVNAATENQSSFVPTPPCRLFDTRPGNEPTTGKKTALGAGELNVHTQQVTGAVGNCQIPNDAVAISMNVTAVNGTAQSNLRVYPANVPTPTASNLNWTARQSPTPNKVDVQLSPDGKVALYNQNGTVDVVADVVGYYSPNALDEVQLTLTEMQGQLDAQRAQITALQGTDDELRRALPIIESVTASALARTDHTPRSVLDVELTAPTDGRVTVSYVGLAQNAFEEDRIICNVYRSADIPPTDIDLTDPGTSTTQKVVIAGEVQSGSVVGSRTFDISAAEPTVYSLACESTENPGAVRGRSLTAVFTAT
ncbi:MAG: hypothetical protein AAFY28_09380 [Actinomycetota bacterium]